MRASPVAIAALTCSGAVRSIEILMTSSEQLATYLNDHVAGSTAARDLLQRSAEKAAGTALGEFLTSLLEEIETDRSELQSIMRRLDVGERSLKQAAGSVMERLSRFKFETFDEDGGAALNRLLELESVLMGIEGKAALWGTLKVLASTEPRIADVDFDRLGDRARKQQEAVERHRLALVPDALV